MRPGVIADFYPTDIFTPSPLVNISYAIYTPGKKFKGVKLIFLDIYTTVKIIQRYLYLWSKYTRMYLPPS